VQERLGDTVQQILMVNQICPYATQVYDMEWRRTQFTTLSWPAHNSTSSPHARRKYSE